jgi:hypothetical protein
VPYVKEGRIALLVVKYSKFLNNQRPYSLPENQRSAYFYNDPSVSYSKFDMMERREQAHNVADSNLIQALEYKEKIKNLIKQIVDQRINKLRIEKQGHEEIRNAQQELEKLTKERYRVKELENEVDRV